MRLIAVSLFISLFLVGCSKNESPEPGIVICFPTPDWLQEKVEELKGCTCITAIWSGQYNNQTVYEIRVVDPVCNGINVVYKADGTVLLGSTEQAAYAHYLANAKELKELWRCSQTAK